MRGRRVGCLIRVSFLLLIASSPLVRAETVVLKSGKQIEGKIIEKTDEYIKIEVSGVPLTFWLDEVVGGQEELDDAPGTVNLGSSSFQAEAEKYLNELGQFYLNKEYGDALVSLKKLLELYPDRPDLHQALGVLYYYVGRSQEAVSSFEKALIIQPNEPNTYLCLGIVYDSLGRQSEAGEALNKAIELFKEDLKVEYILVAETLLKNIGKDKL